MREVQINTELFSADLFNVVVQKYRTSYPALWAENAESRSKNAPAAISKTSTQISAFNVNPY